jgi:hypothetical protein
MPWAGGSHAHSWVVDLGGRGGQGVLDGGPRPGGGGRLPPHCPRGSLSEPHSLLHQSRDGGEGGDGAARIWGWGGHGAGCGCVCGCGCFLPKWGEEKGHGLEPKGGGASKFPAARTAALNNGLSGTSHFYHVEDNAKTAYNAGSVQYKKLMNFSGGWRRRRRFPRDFESIHLADRVNSSRLGEIPGAFYFGKEFIRKLCQSRSTGNRSLGPYCKESQQRMIACGLTTFSQRYIETSIIRLEECGEVWSGRFTPVDPFIPLPPKGQSSRASAACVLVSLLWMVVLGNL